jgi:hypothetical protein
LQFRCRGSRRESAVAQLFSLGHIHTTKHINTKTMKHTLLTTLLVAPLLFSGCASIVDGGPKTVQISSNPKGAKVTISNKDGKEISVITTPATVSLKRAHGFFSAEDYKLVFDTPGYYPYETHIKSTVNGWYFGNIVLADFWGF